MKSVLYVAAGGSSLISDIVAAISLFRMRETSSRVSPKFAPKRKTSKYQPNDKHFEWHTEDCCDVTHTRTQTFAKRLNARLTYVQTKFDTHSIFGVIHVECDLVKWYCASFTYFLAQFEEKRRAKVARRCACDCFHV